MPEPQPDLDVATHLVAQLGAPFALGTNVFASPVRPQGGPIPAKAIFVLSTGGPGPSPYLGTGAGSTYVANLQVRVRSGPADYDGGLATARACRAALHRAVIAGYFRSLIAEAEPIYLLQDAAGNHEWSINFELSRSGAP